MQTRKSSQKTLDTEFTTSQETKRPKKGSKDSNKKMNTDETQKTMAATTCDPNEDMKNFIREKLDEQTVKLSQQIYQINVEINKLKETTDELTKSVEYNSAEIGENQARVKQLEKSFVDYREEVDRKFLTLELYQRRPNLLIYGIADDRNPEEAVRELFEELQLPDSLDLLQVHRLPRHSTNERTASMPKPILVRFLRMKERQMVQDASYKHSSLLRDKQVSIRTDMPVILKKYRGKLATKTYHMRTKQQLQTRIREQGVDVTLEYRRNAQSPWIKIGLEDEIV